MPRLLVAVVLLIQAVANSQVWCIDSPRADPSLFLCTTRLYLLLLLLPILQASRDEEMFTEELLVERLGPEDFLVRGCNNVWGAAGCMGGIRRHARRGGVMGGLARELLGGATGRAIGRLGAGRGMHACCWGGGWVKGEVWGREGKGPEDLSVGVMRCHHDA